VEHADSFVGLMVVGDRSAEIDRGERREDECLQRSDEADLEDEENDPEGQREEAEPGDAEQNGERPGHEQDDQVPGQDVREETYGERQQAQLAEINRLRYYPL